MRSFDYIKVPEQLLKPEIVQMVGSIHEHKGKQELFLEANIDELKTLLEVALIQSTGASNRIEGIYTTDKRLEELVSQKAEPRNRSEQEISGYREVLATIYESYEYINPRSNIILQLHRDLYSYSQGNVGGSYKNSDNVIAETDAEGHQKARFIPVPAFQTVEAMNELCQNLLEAWEADHIDKLILIPMFILDFLCIHPFNDGNGRTARLMSGYILDYYGYGFNGIGSLEEYFAYDSDEYYASLQMGLPALYYSGRENPPHPEIWINYFLKMMGLYSKKVYELLKASEKDELEGSLSYLNTKEKEFLVFLLKKRLYEFTPIEVSKMIGVTNKMVINRCAKLANNGFLIPIIVKTRVRSYRLSDFSRTNEKKILKKLS